MDKTLETVVNRHLAAENAHRMEETLAELHPDCLFEDLPLGKSYRGRAVAEAYYRLWWDAFNLEVKGERRHWSEGRRFHGRPDPVSGHPPQPLSRLRADRQAYQLPTRGRHTVPRRSDGR